MSALLFAVGICALAGAGGATLRLQVVRELDWPARASIMLCSGMVFMSTAMYVMSIAGIEWSRVSLLIPFIALTALAVRTESARRSPRRIWIAVGAFVAATTYAAMTARMTCGDLLFFWGAKANRFYYTGSIDVPFLQWPQHYLMHPDYPPLIPLVYAWGANVAQRFSWWGTLLVTPILLAAAVAAFRGLAARAIGDASANFHAALLAAILALTYVTANVGGAGEPPLLLFEVIALSALTFAPGDRSANVLAAIALAGAVFTKVEGVAFAAVALTAFAATARQLRRAALVAIPAAILLGSWLLFARHYGLLDTYVGREPLRLRRLGTVTLLVIRQVSYRSWYLPWIAAALPLLLGRSWRRAALPLLVAAGAIAYTIYFYLHGADPSWWIASSADRVMITPLAALVVASAASSE